MTTEFEMYCERYHCKMSVAACVRRREVAREKAYLGDPRVVNIIRKDPWCLTCEMGDENEKKEREKMKKKKKEKINDEKDVMKDEGEQGLVDTKRCKECGEELPVDSFYKSGVTSDGWENKCKECRYKQVIKNRKIKKTGDDLPKSDVERNMVMVDLTRYPEVVEWLHEVAENEDRSVDMQVRHFLRGMYERLESAGDEG